MDFFFPLHPLQMLINLTLLLRTTLLWVSGFSSHCPLSIRFFFDWQTVFPFPLPPCCDRFHDCHTFILQVLHIHHGLTFVSANRFSGMGNGHPASQLCLHNECSRRDHGNEWNFIIFPPMENSEISFKGQNNPFSQQGMQMTSSYMQISSRSGKYKQKTTVI